MKEQMKRWISLLLAVVMVFTMMPVRVFAIEVMGIAEDSENLRQLAKDTSFPLENISGNIAILGDSTISGYPKYSALSTYFSVADGYAITDISKAGDTIVGQLNKWNALFSEVKNSLNYVFVQIGLNDIDETVEAFRTQYKSLIAQIRTDAPNAMLILGTMVPCKQRWQVLYPNDWQEYQERWEIANEDIQSGYYDCDRVAYLHTEALGLDGNLRKEYNHGDHIHPNASGAKVIAYSWYLAAFGHLHRYDTVVTVPTCTEKGYTTYTCACGESYVADFVDVISEHRYDDGVCIWCGGSKLGSDWIAPEFAEGDYSMVVLPDTQNMVQYWPESYYEQMQWIADNKDALNIQAVMHMGDMVNTNNDTQWTVCENGTDILENAGIPWMPMMGNHDNSTWFNKYYDYATYGTNQSWFGGSYHTDKLDHTYWFVTVGEREYMILSLGWAPSWDVLDWAKGIVEEHSDKNVILNCHAYMNKDGSLLSKGDAHCVTSYLPNYPNGDDVWAAFKDYENVVLAMGGHIYNADLISYVDQNGTGRDVTSLLIDRQNDDTSNKLGMVAVLTFHENSDTVDINWYSTRYDALYRLKNQFPISVPHVCDHNYTVSVAEPTCTTGGGTKSTCTYCGHSYVEEATEPLGHDYTEKVVLPTCAEHGYVTNACTVCGYSESKVFPNDITDAFKWNEGYAISATYGGMLADKNWVASDYVDISAYTSIEIVTGDTVNANTTLGIAFYDASKNYISGVVHTDKVGNEYGILVHNLTIPENAVYVRTTWYSVNHEKYDGATVHTFYCTGYSDEIPALGHEYEAVITAPTCTEKGYTTLTCSRCGDSKLATKAVDMTDQFVWIDGQMIIATTGERKAYTDWQASDFVNISGYASLEIKTANTASTTTSTGLAFYDANKNYISGIKHTDGSGVYGVLIHNVEVPENAVYIRSTWYSDGHPNYNSAFGSFYCVGTVVEYTEALGHNYVPAVTAPTCTEQGYTTYTCACGDSYVDDYTDATGKHSYENNICTDCGANKPHIPYDQLSTVWPSVNTDLTHIICYGQSFSTGSDAPYYSDPTVDNVYVYGGITNSANGTELKHLTASAGNQHPIISAGNVFAKMLTAAGIDTDIVLGSYGAGGRTIAQLMSAERQAEIKAEEGYSYDISSSGKYAVFQNSVSALAQYAQKNEQSISCPAIVYLQGETDQNTDEQLGYPENPARAGYGAGGDKEKYKEYMSRLKEDMQREIMEQYGQTEKPLFIIYQVSGTYTRTQYSSINMAQIEFAQENEDVILVQSPYFTSHYTNSHHLTQNGYRWLGEYIGRSMYTALVEREKSWPMMPESIEVTGKNTVRITVKGAQNGLAIDTWTVENASNSKNLYGFYLQSDGKVIVPTAVSVHENIIELTLPANLASETVYVYYAGRHASGTGNIRDNSTELGFYEYLEDSNDTGTGNNQGVSHSSVDANGNSIIGQKYPMYNWLASFCYEVEVPEPVQRQAAYYHWEMQSDGLFSVTDGNATENPLTLLEGTVTEGVLNKVQYTMEKEIVLEHDRPWAIEWKAAGNGNNYYGGKFLNSTGSDSHAQYLYIPADSRGMVAWGVSSDAANYGFQLNKMGIDYRKEHTYRIENRIADDGANTVYLVVDGVEIGAMTTGYRTSANSSGSAGSMIEEPKNWANGKDIFVNGIGAGGSFLLNNMKLSYLKVWENGQHTHAYEAAVTAPTCTGKGYTTYTCACGDSYVDDYTDATGGHTYENGVCTICGKSVSPYLQQLPDGVMGCSNLYDLLIPVKGYYTATKYDTSNGAVLSVVIPVEPGDRIAASSFASVSENMGSVDGIRVTYLLGDKIVSSLSAGEVYNGYTKNGYITVPEGVDAVCVPWWKPNDTNWMMLSQASKDFAIHSPQTAPAQDPTCTESGYTAGEICQICNASLGEREEILPLGHVYSGDTCTVCGTVNRLARLDGKYVSILGDSISTFNGYSNDATVNTTIGGNGPRYDVGTADTKPGSYCLLDSVDQTWWMDFANRSGMKLLVNNSWAGSQVFGGKTSDGRVIPAAYLDRCVNLHDNTLENNPENAAIDPDVIFIYLGINDYNFNRSNVGTGAINYAGLVSSDGTYVTPANFGEAYGIMLHKMLQAYPDAQIFAMTLLPENLYSVDKTAWEQHNAYIRAAAEYCDIPVVDLAENCAITWENYSGYMIDKIHPTVAGMKLISDCIEAEVVSYYAENPPHTHVYENGVCVGCGKTDPNAAEELALRYDDHYDVTGKVVEIIDAGKPTSYQVGYGVEENAVLDTAVVTMKSNTLVATGIGTAKVKIDGILYEITVTAAPISLLLLAGQSNMQGSEGDENQSIVCPDGMVYSTYGDRYTMTTSNATNFAPSALTGSGSDINVNGTTTNLEDWPIYLLNERGVGKKGPDSGFAYEWVKQTGEKVWVVNAAHGGSSINTWQKIGENYKEALALFTACQETLRKEIAAGHYTLSHMGYFWCQGCTDYSQTAEWYANKYLTMHENFKTQMAFDHDSNSSTDAYLFEFGGIIPVRAGHDYYTSYRQGIYADATSKAYHESFKDLRFTGPRVAQYWMTNNPDLPDIWNVCNIGEDWVWMPDGTNGVAEYFQAHYPNGTVDYTTQVAQKASWYTPTTPAAVHDSIHYNQIGYNEVGREAARNALIMLGEIEKPNVETSVKLLSWDGYTEVTEINAFTAGNSGTLVVPKVYPVWESKNVAYAVTKGLTYDYYDLLSDSPLNGGMLYAVGFNEGIAVQGRELNSYSWELENGVLVSSGEVKNAISRVTGTTENNIFIDTQYRFDNPIVLLHDQNWVLEWKMTGPWYDSNSTTSQKLFCQDGASSTPSAWCLLIKGNENRISIGYYGTNTHVSYGLDLDDYGISMGDTHVYRLANHINEDGTNTIYLFVDGKQVGPMTQYFTGSGGYMGSQSDYLSGKDISFGYLGAPKYLLNNGVIEYISVVESGASSDVHFHDWSDWATVKAPDKYGPGEDVRSCSGCGETESREILSIWQTTNILEHWNELPETVCGELNLWAIMEHDPKYYVNSKGDWGYHSSRDVPSVTIPVNPGDRIYATSFEAAFRNGHGSSNGIRVTWFSVNGVLKTTDPVGTYAEFTANGGYLIAPEGAIAVNVPMWGDSEDYEIYILNRDHTYENGVCIGCGGDDPGWERIPLGDFAAAGVGTGALSSSQVQLSQKTLIAVPYPGAALTVVVGDGYQVNVYSGNNANRINQNSGWLGADGDNRFAYTYTLPESSIYMRLSIRRTDGGAVTQGDLSLSGVTVLYERTSDIVQDNLDVADIIKNTELPVLIHISDIHGDVIRAERAAQFADAVGADALMASGDLTANQPDDWGNALFEAVGKYADVEFVYGIGNHDAQNISASAYQETIYNAYFKENPATPNGEIYYYRDLADQKLRLISVNQQEGASTTTSGGTCYSQAQVDWLVETLKSTPAGYGVVLMYHSPETTIAKAGDPDYSEFFQVGNRYDNPTNSYSGYSGTFLMDLVDAFMLRESFTWNYSEKNGASPVTLNADFTNVAEGVEFIAHMTGHVHSDSVTYLPGSLCKQLLLGVTCTTSMYGADGGYYGLADYSDLNREADNANQDAFNAYVIDREHKTVRVLRVGARQTVSGETRDDMTIPYSVPFEAGDYLFDTEGLVKLDLSDVEWVNYGIQADGTEPTYYPGQRWSTNMIFDVPYEGVTFYIKINAPYEMGIRSGKTDTTMETNYYWLNNKSLTSGNQNRGYVYTIPTGHEKFILSLANVTRDGSNNVTTSNNPINLLELQAAGLEIWYSPELAEEPPYPFDTEDKVQLDLSNVEWVNYGYQPYGPEPTYHVGTRLTANMIFDVPYDGVTFYIKIKAPYELGIRSGETDTTMDTNLGWLNNKFLPSGNNNYGHVYTIPAGHEKFVLTIGNVSRNSANNVSDWYVPITIEELAAAGLEIWYVPGTEEWIPGDITGDGVVNNKDYTRLFRYLSGHDVEVVEAALDVNGDGLVNNKDYTRLFRYLSGHDVTIY